MSTKSRSRNRGCGAVIAFCAAMVPAVADAQDAAIDRIEAIERKIRGLQSELQQLKGELGQAKQQLRQSRSEAQRAREEAREARQDAAKAATAEAQATQVPAQAQAAAAASPPPAGVPEGVKVSMPQGRPTIATADGRVSLAIGGFTQFDMGGYFQHVNPNTEFPQLNNGVNLRRGRLYFVGTFDDFRFNITPDFGDRPDER